MCWSAHSARNMTKTTECALIVMKAMIWSMESVDGPLKINLLLLTLVVVLSILKPRNVDNVLMPSSSEGISASLGYTIVKNGMLIETVISVFRAMNLINRLMSVYGHLLKEELQESMILVVGDSIITNVCSVHLDSTLTRI